MQSRIWQRRAFRHSLVHRHPGLEDENAQNTINVVLSSVKDGDIILMHDLYGTSADAAVVLIPELKKRGYQLVTVSEMASLRGGMTPGQVYHSFRP